MRVYLEGVKDDKGLEEDGPEQGDEDNGHDREEKHRGKDDKDDGLDAAQSLLQSALGLEIRLLVVVCELIDLLHPILANA